MKKLAILSAFAALLSNVALADQTLLFQAAKCVIDESSTYSVMVPLEAAPGLEPSLETTGSILASSDYLMLALTNVKIKAETADNTTTYTAKYDAVTFGIVTQDKYVLTVTVDNENGRTIKGTLESNPGSPDATKQECKTN